MRLRLPCPAYDAPKCPLEAAPCPKPSGPNEAGIDVAALRRHAAFVRTLLDHLDELVPSSGASLAVTEQLIEELTRLGCCTIETAAALARATHGTKLQ